MLSHFVQSRWLHPLAPLKRLSPVDLPSANGFDKPFAASKFDNDKLEFVEDGKYVAKRKKKETIIKNITWNYNFFDISINHKLYSYIKFKNLRYEKAKW